jgi:hypothetical protein
MVARSACRRLAAIIDAAASKVDRHVLRGIEMLNQNDAMPPEAGMARTSFWLGPR